jgi:hypothetical protein
LLGFAAPNLHAPEQFATVKDVSLRLEAQDGNQRRGVDGPRRDRGSPWQPVVVIADDVIRLARVEHTVSRTLPTRLTAPSPTVSERLPAMRARDAGRADRRAGRVRSRDNFSCGGVRRKLVARGLDVQLVLPKLATQDDLDGLLNRLTFLDHSQRLRKHGRLVFRREQPIDRATKEDQARVDLASNVDLFEVDHVVPAPVASATWCGVGPSGGWP